MASLLPMRLAGRVGLGCLLVVPWLNPITAGPAPSVYPWILASACALLLGIANAHLDARIVAIAWSAAAVVSACLGVLQYFGLAGIFGGWVHTTGLGEAFANLRQRNQFATLTSMGLLAVLWLDSSARDAGTSSTSRPVSQNPWPVLALLALAFGNAASGSRTGMLQWALVLGCVYLWTPTLTSRRLGLAVFAVVAYGMAVLLLPILLESSTGTPHGGLISRIVEEPGCGSRRVLWANVLELIIQKPWTGWGWGELDYAHFINLYPGERFCEILDNAHNLPLHLAVELGLPVASLSLGLLMWWLVRNRPWAEKKPTRQMAWAVLAVIGLHSLLEYPLWYGPFQLAVGLCVLLLWRTAPQDPNAVTPTPPFRPHGLSWSALNSTVAALLLAGLGVAAWDYWRVSQLYLLPADRAEAYRDNTLEKVRNSWFFQDQVQFAELTTVALTRQNAAAHYAQALQLLHFSPEPRVIEAVIESAVMLGKDREAVYYLQRYQAAFPQEHAAWVARSARFKVP